MEGENSLIRFESTLHFELREFDGPIKPQDACCWEKGVERGTASPLIFLSLGEEAKEEGLDLAKRDPCRQSKDFNNEQKKKKKGRILCSHPEVGVAFHSRFQKEKKKKIS